MRFLIASDIHGSSLYCRMLLDAAEREDAERCILLGDLLYHGPRNDLPDGYAPKEVIRMLSSSRMKLYCVRGNCEAEVDQMVLPFPVMSESMIMPVGNFLMYVTHGHIYHMDHLPPLKPGDILLHGHTHVPGIWHLESGITVLNPGSVSIPKENSWRGYMILEDTTFVWKDLSGLEKLRWESAR